MQTRHLKKCICVASNFIFLISSRSARLKTVSKFRKRKRRSLYCRCFRPPQKKKCIFMSIERELHVSTSYEFLSFSEPISQDFYPQPTSIDKQSVSSVKLTRNQTRVRSTTQCQLFFLLHEIKLAVYIS